jgi:hypothetical protein
LLTRWGRKKSAPRLQRLRANRPLLRGGITAFQSSTTHQPPRQLDGIVRRQNDGNLVGYYIGILSPSERVPSVAQMRTALTKENLAGTLTVETGADKDWTQVILAHQDGPEIADIERNAASSNDLVSEEIDEFLEEIADCKPASAAAWLAEYLPTVKTIYAFQLLRGIDVKNGWDILGKVKESILTQVGGILQADGEGFSDEEGYHILWQFSNRVKGPWGMGVLKDGAWIHFQMDLGNKKHREAFLRGEMPEGVEMTE